MAVLWLMQRGPRTGGNTAVSRARTRGVSPDIVTILGGYAYPVYGIMLHVPPPFLMPTGGPVVFIAKPGAICSDTP